MIKKTFVIILSVLLFPTILSSADKQVLQRVRGFNRSMDKITINPKVDSTVFRDANIFGANVFRIHGLENTKDPDKPFWDGWVDIKNEYVRETKFCKKYSLKAVICVGFSCLDDYDYNSTMWTNPNLDSCYCRVWKELVTALRDSGLLSVVYGYDLINEPLNNDSLWRNLIPRAPIQWPGLALKIIDTIRKIDTSSWIIYEPGPGGFFDEIQYRVPFNEPKIIYSIHMYDPEKFTQQQVDTADHTVVPYPTTDPTDAFHYYYWDKDTLKKRLSIVRNFQQTYKVPIYVGEFSVCRKGPPANTAQYLKDCIDLFELYGWSWTYHAWHDADFWSLDSIDYRDTMRKINVKAGMHRNATKTFDTVNSYRPIISSPSMDLLLLGN